MKKYNGTGVDIHGSYAEISVSRGQWYQAYASVGMTRERCLSVSPNNTQAE